MRTFFRLAAFVLLVLTCTAFAAPVPKVAKKDDDLKRLDGRWECVSLDGGQGPKADGNKYWFTVRDGKLYTGSGTGKGYDGVAFTLDPTQSPKHLDIHAGGDTLPCIYELDGDTLTWCHPQHKQPRPSEFKGGDGRYCFVCKRVQDK